MIVFFLFLWYTIKNFKKGKILLIYYNQDLQKIDSHDFEYLNQGCCAHVAYDHNIILKQYFSNTNSIYRMKVPVFKILKDIQNPHFIELIDMYSKGGIS